MKPLPAWMLKTIERRHCPRCSRPVAPQHVVGIGCRLFAPSPTVRPTAGPMSYIILRCDCGLSHHFIAPVERGDHKRAVDAIYDRATSTSERRKQPPSTENDTCDDGADKPPPRWEGDAVIAPSNAQCPDTPIRDPEVELFLRQLKRMSFKRRSKSFELIMRKLGYHLDGTPVEPRTPESDDDPAPPF